MHPRPRLLGPSEDPLFANLQIQLQGVLEQTSTTQTEYCFDFERLRHDGSWKIRSQNGNISLDELAIGASAARHLISLGCKDLFYLGANTENLRWRGYSIAAAALHCQAHLMDQHSKPGQGAGIFADGATAETRCLHILQTLHLQCPSDVLILGVDDGKLPTPQAPGFTRLRIDRSSICKAMLQLCKNPHIGHIAIPAAGVITRDSSEQSAIDKRIKLIQSYINTQLHQAIDVDSIALATHISRRSLERLCRQYLGHSPLDEIHKQRVALAEDLLLRSHYSLEDIAARVGFHNADRLRIVFKKIHGMTPTDWRKQHVPHIS